LDYADNKNFKNVSKFCHVLRISSTKLAQKMFKHGVDVYNYVRKHLILKLLTSADVHKNPAVEYKIYPKDKESIEKLLVYIFRKP